MSINTELKTLVQTRQRVLYTYNRGKEQGLTYLVIGPATDGTWMFKTVNDPSWTEVDTEGQCHNHFYDGRTRPVQELEIMAYEQHKVKVSQGRLF